MHIKHLYEDIHFCVYGLILVLTRINIVFSTEEIRHLTH